jgi:hypothetical protein
MRIVVVGTKRPFFGSGRESDEIEFGGNNRRNWSKKSMLSEKPNSCCPRRKTS